MSYPAVHAPPTAEQAPLVVDLDGTLLATDLLYESVLVLVKQDPKALVQLPFWLLKGKAHLKRQIARRVSLDPALLPCHEDVVEFLKQEAESGREIILATASDALVAGAIADHHLVFSTVLSSDGEVNLSGEGKLHAIREHLGPGAAFDYVGNAHVDLPLWTAARRAYLVRPSGRLSAHARRSCEVAREFHAPRSLFSLLARALRVHQWVKNVLLFLPLLLAHVLGDPVAWGKALVAFAAFSLCASAIYIVNDLLDLAADRQHHRKRHRPFAAGTLEIRAGLLMAPLLLTASFALSAALLPWEFTALLAFYLAVTTAYSFYLKRLPVVDVLVLAGLYTLRIFAGGFAVGVPISEWLVAFSMFFFLSLAFVKRYAELFVLNQKQGGQAQGRDYAVGDMDLLRSMGTASGFLSVLVLSLYVSSDEVKPLYDHPKLLWLVGPLLLYWITRVWFLAQRGRMHDDPVVFAARDRVSYLIGLAVALIVLAAVV